VKSLCDKFEEPEISVSYSIYVRRGKCVKCKRLIVSFRKKCFVLSCLKSLCWKLLILFFRFSVRVRNSELCRKMLCTFRNILFSSWWEYGFISVCVPLLSYQRRLQQKVNYTVWSHVIKKEWISCGILDYIRKPLQKSQEKQGGITRNQREDQKRHDWRMYKHNVIWILNWHRKRLKQ